MKRQNWTLFAVALAVVGLLYCAPVRAAVPEGIWAIAGKVAVRVFDCAGSLCGRVVWLGDPALRTPEMCGKTIIWGLRAVGLNDWSDGWFFDPENGHTYNVTASLQSSNTISVLIYPGAQFLGRTEILHRISLDQLQGTC